MRYQINLIYREKKALTEKALYFIYHYLRYILVITQIIVIFVFFNKIKYDQKIIDLQEIVSQQKEIFRISKPLVDEYLLIKKNLNTIENLFDSQKKLNNQIKYLLSVFPKGVILTELEYKENAFALTGKSIDPQLIKAFYSKLKQDSLFQNIVLEGIKKNEYDYDFTINLSKFKQK